MPASVAAHAETAEDGPRRGVVGDAPAPSLEVGTQLAAGSVSIYTDCGEATWTASQGAPRAERGEDDQGDPSGWSTLPPEDRAQRNRKRAARRARTRIRRLACANRMTYLWTLTYAVEPGSRDEVVTDLGHFFKRLNRALGGRPARIAVIEKGSTNGRLHAHFLTNSRIPHAVLTSAWGHGYTFVRHHGRGHSSARRVAAYAAKYAGKDIAEGYSGRQSYLVSEGLTVGRCVKRKVSSSDALWMAAQLLEAGPDAVLTRSADWDDYDGPPAWWFGVP